MLRICISYFTASNKNAGITLSNKDGGDLSVIESSKRNTVKETKHLTKVPKVTLLKRIRKKKARNHKKNKNSSMRISKRKLLQEIASQRTLSERLLQGWSLLFLLLIFL